MNWNFSEMAKLFSDADKGKLLAAGNFGIELESQRIDSSGDLALTPHPEVFGDKLQNKRITTDFAESQIEIITPTFNSVEEVYASLLELHDEVEAGIGEELLWPLSMPPRLPDEDQIPVAKFSNGNSIHEKESYRNGLALRHGKKMQMISGIHYNFSFSTEMIDYLHKNLGGDADKREFVNDMYFSLTRNFLRYRWLLVYLFGASPFCDQSYYSVICKELDEVKKCCPYCCDPIEKLSQYSTSLRVSRFGYSDNIQHKYNVLFNSLNEYISKLEKMLTTEHPDYAELGRNVPKERNQLNANILQKESEFYSSIRPRQNTEKDETQLDALSKRGVEYIEVRLLDINPFEKLGMTLGQLYFLKVFMAYCLFEESNNLNEHELEKINSNHHLSALYGRKDDLLLYEYENGTIALKDFAETLFEKLIIVAKLMDNGDEECKHFHSVENERDKLFDKSKMPSELMHHEMKENNESFHEFGIRQAVNNSSRQPEELRYDSKGL
jgi:glutamate--cysteine ligase